MSMIVLLVILFIFILVGVPVGFAIGGRAGGLLVQGQVSALVFHGRGRRIVRIVGIVRRFRFGQLG